MDNLRVAVVTGAAGGLGLGLAASLADRGMSVVLADIDADGLATSETSLREGGANVSAIPTDVTQANSVENLAAEALDRYGRVDVVCLNAGVSMRGSAWELSLEDWRWVYDVNVFGVVHGIRAFVPTLLTQGAGHVLITASNSATTTLPSVAPYVSSKHAVVAIAETLQHDLRNTGSNVAVSVALPGAIRSRMADALKQRPAEYGDASLPAGAVEASRSYLAQFGADPRKMADHILREALDSGQFCIFTDEPDRTVILEHAQALSKGNLPAISHAVAAKVD